MTPTLIPTPTFEDLHGEWNLHSIDPSPNHPFDKAATGFAFTICEPEQFCNFYTVIVFEDPDDGYRSTANNPIIVFDDLLYDTPTRTIINIPVLIAPMTSDVACEGIQIQDRRNGKIILRLGTNNTEDYYPFFIAEWTPENIAS
jgi:hypothetical protein